MFKKLVFVVVCLLTFSGHARGATLVQKKTCATNGVTSLACAFTSTPSAHSTLYYSFEINNTTVNLTGTDNANTVVDLGCPNKAAGGANQQNCHKIVYDAVASATTFTATDGGTLTNYIIYMYEFSGLPNSSAALGLNGFFDGNGTAMTVNGSGGITTSSSQLIIFSFFDQNGSTCSTPTGVTGFTSADATPTFSRTVYNLSAAAGTYNPSCSTLSGVWVSSYITLNLTVPAAAKRNRAQSSRYIVPKQNNPMMLTKLGK
jgi:hypothetical protein